MDEREMNQKTAKQISLQNRAPTDQLSGQKFPRVRGILKHIWNITEWSL